MTDLLRQEIAALATTMVVKVGTRVLTRADGRLNEERIEQLAEELHGVIESGRKVVLVSSGAVGAGIGRLGLTQRPTDVAHLQAVAAVGQSVLVEAYERCLRTFGRHAAQVLLTAGDLDRRTSYLNARNTILTLLHEYNAVPIINENDTVSVEELQTTFGDNDRLAAIVTNLIQAPLLVLLSDVEGLYNGDPRDSASTLISTVERLDQSIFDLVRDRVSGLSKGGMASKLKAARQATAAGENVIIANGRSPGTLDKIIAGESVGTLVLAQGHSVAARKRWIGFTAQPRGHLVLDDGARKAVECQGRSLLAAGILKVIGHFNKGDVVGLRDSENLEFARGLTNYSSDDIQRIRGLKTAEIADILGHCPHDEIIHRNNMAVTS
ncbi:MAG: glutamate 5-kinase [Thermoguttaceae bacterium]